MCIMSIRIYYHSIYIYINTRIYVFFTKYNILYLISHESIIEDDNDYYYIVSSLKTTSYQFASCRQSCCIYLSQNKTTPTVNIYNTLQCFPRIYIMLSLFSSPSAVFVSLSVCIWVDTIYVFVRLLMTTYWRFK